MPHWVQDEDKWEKAKEVVKDQYGKDEDDGDDFWKLVTGVYKKMGGGIKGEDMLVPSDEVLYDSDFDKQ